MCLGFVGSEGQILFHKEVIVNNKEETLVEFDLPTSEAIVAIIPNYQDWTFAKIVLDEVSLKWVMSNISKLEGELTRQLVWRSLFDMMRDSREISSPELAYMMMENYVLEKSIAIRDKLFSFILGTIGNYCPQNMVEDLKRTGFMLVMDLILKETEDVAVSKNLHAKVSSFLTNDKDCLAQIAKLLKGTHEYLKLEYYTMGNKLNFLNVLFATKALPEAELQAMLEKLEAEDKTDAKRQAQ